MLRLFAGVVSVVAGAIVLCAQGPFRIQPLAGSGSIGDGGSATLALIEQAEGVAVDPSGTIYIADAASHRIRAVSPAGEIRTVAGNGESGYAGDGGPAVNASLNSPYGLSLDQKGNLFIADLGNARIRVVSTDGRIRTSAGGGTLLPGQNTEGSPATSIRFRTPRNVLAEPSGGFYFSDFDGHRVFYVDPRGILTIFAGTGNPGYGADNIPAVRSALRNPAGLAFDPQGSIIIVESGSQRLRRIVRGTVSAYLSDALRNYPLFSPTGAAFDAAGNLYIADARAAGALKRSPQGEIRALNVAGRDVAADPRGGAVFAGGTSVVRVDAADTVTIAAGRQPGSPEVTGDGGLAAAARFIAPSGLAYDREGNLYISDERAHRIRRVTPTGYIATFAGTGKPAYSGDGGPAPLAGLNQPRGLAFDKAGFLYVADSGNHALRRISPDGFITTVTGNGFSGFIGDGGNASAARLHEPSSVAIGAGGEIYIADSKNHRIRQILTSGTISTFAGSGRPGDAFDGSAAHLAQLNDPRGVALDAEGNLYIADSANHRVRVVNTLGVLTTVGKPDFVFPVGLSIGLAGLYVADAGSHRVFYLAGGTPISVAGSASGFSGDGGPAPQARLNSPASLAVDANGNLIVADTGNGRVRQLLPDTLLIAVLESGVRIFNAASRVETPVVPGMIATLVGQSLGPLAAVTAPAGAAWPLQLGEVVVKVAGEAVPLLYVSSNQINVQLPYTIPESAQVRIEVIFKGASLAEVSVPVAQAAPGLFPQIVMADGSINAPANPVGRGSVVMLFATGTGLLPAEAVAVAIGSIAAETAWAGPAPGIPGLLQVNVRLPTGFFPPGEYPVSFRVGAFAAPPGATIYLQ